jgi:hypothetical protein
LAVGASLRSGEQTEFSPDCGEGWRMPEAETMKGLE